METEQIDTIDRLMRMGLEDTRSPGTRRSSARPEPEPERPKPGHQIVRGEIYDRLVEQLNYIKNASEETRK